MYIHIYIYMYICVCVCIYIYIYMYLVRARPRLQELVGAAGPVLRAGAAEAGDAAAGAVVHVRPAIYIYIYIYIERERYEYECICLIAGAVVHVHPAGGEKNYGQSRRSCTREGGPPTAPSEPLG